MYLHHWPSSGLFSFLSLGQGMAEFQKLGFFARWINGGSLSIDGVSRGLFIHSLL